MFATLALALAVQYPATPAADGASSFGPQPDLRQVEALFRKPAEEDLEFLASMRNLVVEVHTQLALAEARAAKHGLMNLVLLNEPGPPGARLEALLDRIGTLRKDPFRAGLDQDQAISLARAVGDGQLLSFEPLIAAAREDVPLLLAALDLLHGHTYGLVQLESADDLAVITRLADLAAARLRAARLDIKRLAKPVHAGPAPLRVDELRVARGVSEAANSSRRDYMNLVNAGRQQERLLASASILARFDKTHAKELGDRRRAREEARLVAERLPLFLPIYDGQRELAEPWRDMSSSERARLAVRLGLAALDADPLSPSLTYLVALGLEFSSGRKAAEPYFDRFLVLKGIRHYDHRSFKDRELDVFEEYALLRIAGWTPEQAVK